MIFYDVHHVAVMMVGLRRTVLVALIFGSFCVQIFGESVTEPDENVEEEISSPCQPPQLALNGSESETGEERIRKEYTHIREVKFSGSIGPLGERRLCKIKCIGGQWVGPLCVDQHDDGRFHPLFRNCKLEYINPHLVVTFRNTSIHSAGWVFPHGAKLQLRCREVGLYKLVGTASPRCENGVWSSRLPSCVPTTMLTNFTDDSPPTILIRIPSGSASVEPAGELAVFPGSTLHLECLFARRLGSPDWTWTSPLGQYLTGWAIASEERNFKYRLSIYYAKMQDSGTFTCATPRGNTNSITLKVTAVHCDPITVKGPHLTVRVEGTKLGHSAIFQCPIGFYVSGSSNLTCQASGKWSAIIPRCEPVKCPQLDGPGEIEEPHLHLEEHNNTYGGRAVFVCAWGYRLLGPPGLECEISGNWSGPLPKCIPIQCPPPSIPANAHLIQSESAGMDGGRYAVGSLVQFACRGAHQLEGEASIICTETGFWSHPPPLCRPRCPYLGDPDNGVVAPIKYAYEPGDELQITCNPGYESRLENRPKCLSDGRWSSPLPNCTNYSQI
ncbi:locomotion-related protein Hikaru genki [Harmonia axyridis]|uniref:locomotion-related protein Hikaru genki n=1 Tax=Harmonia axyridis TaxID=115357 RepID=UPI001E2753CD|nr:locomotion-related protein Hikaru genki [Harmonia axyridis]